MKFHWLNKQISLQIFQLLRFGGIFTVSVFLARYISDTAIIGFYEKLLLIGSSTSFFWVSGIINTFIPAYEYADEVKKKKLTTSVFIFLSLTSVMVVIALSVFTETFKDIHQQAYLLFLLYSLFNAPAFFTEYVMLVRNKPLTILWYGCFSFLLHVIALCMPLLWHLPLEVSLCCLAFTAALRYLLLVTYIKINIGFYYDKDTLKDFAKKSLPYIASLLLGGSLAFTDSYTISWYFHDDNVFALFRYGARELPFVMLMANAFSNVHSGELAAAHKENRLLERLKKMKNDAAKYMHILFPVTLVFILFSKRIFLFFYGENFTEAAYIFCIYLLLTISRLLFPQAVLLALQKNKTLLRCTAWEWVVNVGCNLSFVVLFGLQGVAYATVSAYFFEKILLIYYTSKEGISLTSYTPVRTWLIWSVITIACFILVKFIL